MKSVGRGVVASIGLSPCKREVRLSAAYGVPLDTVDGHRTAFLTWVVRRARTTDGLQVWEARAFESGIGDDEVRLSRLEGLSYCRSAKFGAMLHVIGLLRSIARPSLMGAQRLFVDQVDCFSLPVSLEYLRHTAGFFEVENT
jgi:hypothetical protein